jgi:hypothetical protein
MAIWWTPSGQPIGDFSPSSASKFHAFEERGNKKTNKQTNKQKKNKKKQKQTTY